MRDKERINRILYLLRHIWEKHPDMRLLQLIFNAVDTAALEGNRVITRRGYNTEDDYLEQCLTEFSGLHPMIQLALQSDVDDVEVE